MKAVCLVLGVVLLAASLACITWTVVEVVRKEHGIGSGGLWGAVAFHAVAAMVACVLLSVARRPQAPEAEPAAGREGES